MHGDILYLIVYTVRKQTLLIVYIDKDEEQLIRELSCKFLQLQFEV